MKNPLVPAWIEPTSFWFVAQPLNHCATAVRPIADYNTKNSQETDICAAGRIRTGNSIKRAVTGPCIRPRGRQDWLPTFLCHKMWLQTINRYSAVSYLGAFCPDALRGKQNFHHRVRLHDPHELFSDLHCLYLEVDSASAADVSSEAGHDLRQVVLKNCVG